MLEALGAKARESEGLLGHFSGAIENVALPMAGVGAAVGAATIGLGLLGEKYDDAMISVKNYGQLTQDQSDKVQQAFVSISNAGGASFTQLASATSQYEGVIKGLPSATQDVGDKTQQVVGSAQDLSEALGVNLTSAIGDLVPLMQAYQVPTEKAGEVSNQLADIAEKTGIPVDALANTFEKTKGKLGDLAPSFSDTGALLEELASHGITGQRALMGVSSGLGALYAQTPAATKELKALGITITDTSGNFLPLPQILANVSDKTKNLTEAQRQQALAHIFGSQAGALFGSVLNDGAGALDKYKASLDGSSAAEDGAAERSQTLSYQMERVKNVLENAGAMIGEKIAPYLVQMATKIADVVPKIIAFGESFMHVLSFLRPFIPVIGLIIGAIVGLGAAFAALGPVIAGIGAVVGSLISVFISVAPEAEGIAGILAGINLPLIAIIGAVALLALAWKNDWGGIREKVQSAIAAILPRLKEFEAFLSGAFRYAWTFVRDAALTFIQALSGNWSDDSKIRPLHRAIGDLGLIIRNDVVPAIKQMAQFIVGEVVPAAQRFASFMTGTAIPAIERFGQSAKIWIEGTLIPAFQKFATDALPKLEAFGSWIVNTAVPAIVSFGTQAKQWFQGTLLPALSAVGQLIETQLKPSFDHLWASIQQAGQTIQTNLNPMLAQAKQIFDELKAAIDPQVIAALTTIGNVISTYVMPVLKTLLEDYLKVLVAFWGTVFIATVKLAAGVLSGVFKAAVDLVIGIIKVCIDSIQTWVDVFTNMVQLVDDLIHGKWSKAWDDAKQLVVQFIQDTIALFSDAGTWLLAAGVAIVQGLIDGIGSMVDAAKQAAEKAANAVVDGIKGVLHIKSPSQVMVDVGQNIIKGLAQGIDETDAVVQAANSASTQIVNAIMQGLVSSKFANAIPELEQDMLPAILSAQQSAAKDLNLAELAGASDADIAKLKENLRAANDLLQAWSAKNHMTVQQFMQDAQDAAQAANQQQQSITNWQSMLGNFTQIVSGQYIPQLKGQIKDLNAALLDAEQNSAPKEVIDALTAQVNTAINQLGIATQIYNGAIKDGAVAAQQAQAAAQQTASTISQVLNDPSIVKQDQDAATKAAQAYQLGLLNHLPQAEMTALAQAAEQAKATATQAGQILAQATAAGFVQGAPAISDAAVAQIQALEKTMTDGGANLIDSIAAAVENGSLTIDNALKILPTDINGVVLPALQQLQEQLQEQLAQAMLTGANNVDQLTQSLQALQAMMQQVADTAATTAPAVTYSGNTDSTAASSSSGTSSTSSTDLNFAQAEQGGAMKHGRSPFSTSFQNYLGGPSSPFSSADSDKTKAEGLLRALMTSMSITVVSKLVVDGKEFSATLNRHTYGGQLARPI